MATREKKAAKDLEPRVESGEEPKAQASQGAKRRRELVNRAIETIEKKLESGELKPSVGDMLKLLEYQDGEEREQVKEVVVRWVETEEAETQEEPRMPEEPASGQ